MDVKRSARKRSCPNQAQKAMRSLAQKRKKSTMKPGMIPQIKAPDLMELAATTSQSSGKKKLKFEYIRLKEPPQDEQKNEAGVSTDVFESSDCVRSNYAADAAQCPWDYCLVMLRMLHNNLFDLAANAAQNFESMGPNDNLEEYAESHLTTPFASEKDNTSRCTNESGNNGDKSWENDLPDPSEIDRNDIKCVDDEGKNPIDKSWCKNGLLPAIESDREPNGPLPNSPQPAKASEEGKLPKNGNKGKRPKAVEKGQNKKKKKVVQTKQPPPPRRPPEALQKNEKRPPAVDHRTKKATKPRKKRVDHPKKPNYPGTGDDDPRKGQNYPSLTPKMVADLKGKKDTKRHFQNGMAKFIAYRLLKWMPQMTSQDMEVLMRPTILRQLIERHFGELYRSKKDLWKTRKTKGTEEPCWPIQDFIITVNTDKVTDKVVTLTRKGSRFDPDKETVKSPEYNTLINQSIAKFESLLFDVMPSYASDANDQGVLLRYFWTYWAAFYPGVIVIQRQADGTVVQPQDVPWIWNPLPTPEDLSTYEKVAYYPPS